MITFNLERTLDGGDMGSPDFDHVYHLTYGNERGEHAAYATDQHADGRPWGWAPDVRNDREHDVEISDGWQLLTGHSGQHGYTGPIMHPSELWSRCHVDDLIRLADDDSAAGLLFAVVEVYPDLDEQDNDDYSDESPVGWAVAYRMVAPGEL